MRLPSDATLLVIDAGSDDAEPARQARIDAVLQSWRNEKLPVIHIRLTTSPHSLIARPCRRATAAEPCFATPDHDAFGVAELDALLEGAGATTLVLCGDLSPLSIEAATRHGAALGYRMFVVADACAGFSTEDVLPAPSGGDAVFVDTAMTLRAALAARNRLRLRSAGPDPARSAQLQA